MDVSLASWLGGWMGRLIEGKDSQTHMVRAKTFNTCI